MWPTSVVPDGLPLPPTELINQDDFTYKATPCRYFQAARGECRFGNTCRFAHGFHEQRRPGYGPTPAEAEQLGRPLPPALQAWWHQARANLQQGNLPVPHQGQRVRAASTSGANGQPVMHGGEDEDLRRLREQFPDEYQRAMEQQGQYNGAAPPPRRSGPGDARNLAAGTPPFPNPHAYSQAPQRPVVQPQQMYQQPVYQQPQHVPQPYQQHMPQHQQMRQQEQQLHQSGNGAGTGAEFRTLVQGVTAFKQELESFLSSPESMTRDLRVTSTLWDQRRNYYRKLGLEMADKIMALGVGVADLEHTDPVKCEELRRQRAAAEADYMVLAPLLKQMVQLWKPVKKRLDEAIAAAAAAPAAPVPVVAPQAVPATYLQPHPVANAFVNGSQMHTSMAGGAPATQHMGTVQAAANGRQPASAVAAAPALPAPQAVAPVAQQPARPTMVGTVTNAAKSVFNATMQAAASASTALFTGDPAPPARAAPVQPAPQPATAKPAAPQAKEAPTRPTVVPNAPTVAAAQPVAAAAGPGKAKAPTPAGAATLAAPAAAAAAPAAAAATPAAAAQKQAVAGKVAKAAASNATDTAPAVKVVKPGTLAVPATAADAPATRAGADQAAAAPSQRPAQAGAGTSAAVDAAPKDQGARNGQAIAGNGQQAAGSAQQRGSKGAVKAVQAAPPPPPPPKVYPEEIIKQGEQSMTLLKNLHAVWAPLFTPIVNSPQPVAVVKAAVDVLTGKPKYHNLKGAVKYFTSRHKTLTLLRPNAKEYVYSLGITDDWLMDGMPNWRNAPSTERQYVAALLWEVAATDEPDLLERVDTYMDRGENQAELPAADGTEPVLGKGCWKSFKQDKTGSFAANLVKNNKHKVLAWALSKHSIDDLFALDKHAWRPVANTTSPSTGMYAWAKSLGGGAEAILVMMEPWRREQEMRARQQEEAEKQARQQRTVKPKPNPTVVKEQFALIHSLVTDGLQPEVVGKALEFALLSVQWTPEQGSLWTVDAAKPCSFLHFVLHVAHPDQCAGLVQVAVDKLMRELRQSGSPTATELKQNVSFYVRQKDHDGRAPLMIAIERCSRLSALTRHLPAVLLALLIHGADPLCDNFQQLVDTTPMHTLILKVDKGVVDVDTGAKALFHLAKYARPQPKENDLLEDDDGLDNVIVTNSSQYLMNVLAAAINSTAGPQRLVEALINARPDINPAKLLQFDGPSGQDKVYQTPLAMALVAKPPRPARPEMAKQLLTCWRPEMLLDAMDARQSPEIREEVKRLLQANNEATLKPLAALEEAELKPLLDAALGEKETHLLELVLKNVPQARFESLDLVNRNVPIECMMDLARRGAHAHLGKPWEQLPTDPQARFEAKLAFLQNLLDTKLALYPTDQSTGTCTLPNDQVVYGQRWQAANDSRFSYRERESFKVMRLLSVNDQDNIGPLSERYLPRCRASVACMFGRGLGAGKSTTELLKQMLQAGTADPNERDPSRCGMTLLHLAAADSAAEAVKALVMAGADVMARIEPRPGAAEGDAATDKKGAKKGTSSALNAIHDALTDFTPLHIAAKVFADMIASYNKAINSIEEAADLLECHTNYVDASGRQVFEYLLDKDPRGQSGARAPQSKGKKGLTARAVLGGEKYVTHMYDAICEAAAKKDQERVDKAEKAALKHAAPPSAATVDVLAAKNSQGVKQRVSMPIDRQEQVEKDLHRALVSGVTTDGMDISAIVTIWASLPPQKQEASLVDILVKTMSADTAAAGSATGEGADGAELTDAERLRIESFSAVRQVIDDMLPDDSHQWVQGDDDAVPDDPNAVYSDDDVPEPEPLPVVPVTRAANNAQIVAQEEGNLRSLDTEALLQDLDWMFTITKEARQSWASLEPFAKRLVLKRLQEIGRGMWQRSGGVKRLPPESDQLRGLDLWRLKINKAGRILFEVAVEYYEEKDCWSECIRLWCITLNHKKYEECIIKVHDSYRRSQQVNEKRKLQALWPDAGGGGGVHESEDAVRKPRTFQDNSLDRNQLMAMGPTAAEGKRVDRPKATGPEREHLPPANYDPEQFTLLKMYNVDSVLLQTVMHRLTDAQVELPFKVSPVEWEIITQVPRPPCSTILLGRSGTGKTTCAVYRMWGKWLTGYKQWVPGQQALAAAGAGDAARAMGDEEGADAAAEFAAKTVGGTTIFVTASATLKESVKKAFRKMQKAAMKPDEYKAVEEAGRVVYHSFRNVPPEAFPLFLTSRQYLEMVDASTAWPFFKRRADGTIIKGQDPDKLDNDSTEIVMNLEFDQDEGEDEFEDEDEAGNAVAEAEAEAEEEEEELREQVVIDQAAGGVRDEGVIYQAPIPLAGKVAADKEVTWLYFKNEMWHKITTPEQRVRLQPALVWAEICSYIKGSMQAIDTEEWGHLTMEAYKNIGDKRAANFTKEERETVIWPIFRKYQSVKAQARRYDMMDFVAHIYDKLKTQGYQGVPISSLYRDEVQDFTQAELALDLKVVADPNSLFYCGDTAQTIARGVGFRFKDITHLLYAEGKKREAAQLEALQQEGRRRQVVTVGKPQIQHLTTNYRTHQGILNTAAMVVDLLKIFYPYSIDKLQREKALFPGPPPILLAGTESTDLTYLLVGTDRSNSQVEFGANQVILVRTMAASDELPEEIRQSNALIMTVPQAKGLEFDDVFLFNFFKDSAADAAEWRVLNKFVKDFGEGKDYALKAASDNPELVQRYKEHHQQAYTEMVQKEGPGYLRPTTFSLQQHVLLQEELKHLYTAITRAKSNVVFFDLDKEKRAPFYNVLRSFGMARVVNRSLLDDGADAKEFGLVHTAKDSKQEWFKRAKGLMEKRSPGLAAKAFLQAGDHVRASAALARHLRMEATGEADQDQHTQRAPLTQEEKRRKLLEVAFRSLVAVQRAREAPNPVSRAELKRWVRLAAQCLSEIKLPAAAAQLHALVHGYKTARTILQALGEFRALAVVCIQAYHYYAGQAARAKAAAQSARSHLLFAGKDLANMLEDDEAGQARTAHQEEAEEKERAEASATKLAHMYRARAAHAYWLADDLEQSLQILHAHGISREVQQVWPNVHKDVLKMSQVLQDVGKRAESRRALDLLPDSKDKEEQCKRFGMWDEVTAMRMRRGDVLGVVRVLMGQRQHQAAAQKLLDLMIARGAHLQHESAPSAANLQFPAVDPALAPVADQPVPAEAFSLLATCTLALQSRGDVASLPLQLAVPAAEEVGARAELDTLIGLGWVMEGVLPDEQGGARSVKAQTRRPLDPTTKAVLLNAPGCVPFLEYQASVEQRLDVVARSLGLTSGTIEMPVLAQYIFECIQTGAIQVSQGTAEALESEAGSIALERLLQNLQLAATGLEGLAALQQMRQPTAEQQDALRHFELHYGVASRSPTAGVIRDLGATNLLSLDYSDVYLGNASYMWRSLAGMQPEPSAPLSGSKAPPAPAPAWDTLADGPQFLPLRAPRPALLQLLAWDLTRKAHAALVPVLYQALVKQLAGSSGPTGLLTDLSKVKAQADLLLSCLQACQRVQALCKMRNAILPVVQRPSSKKSTGGAAREVQVIPDSPIQPCFAAVQELTGAQEVVRQLEILCVGLLTASSTPTGHPSGFCKYLDSFKATALPRATMSTERFGAALFRLFDAGYPGHGRWQGVNFACWWGYTMLLQHQGNAKKICQRQTPPATADRERLYIQDEADERYMLPEEVLSVASQRMYNGMTDVGIASIATHVHHAVQQLRAQCSMQPSEAAPALPVHDHLTVEPVVLLLEMMGAVLTLSLPDAGTVGNKDLCIPRAYLPSVYVELVTDLPIWGVRQGINPTWRANDLVAFWQGGDEGTEFSKEQSVSLLYNVLKLIWMVAKLISAPGPALATMSQQQMLSLVSQHMARERGVSAEAAAAAAKPLVLPEAVQRARGAVLALRLVRLTASMLLTLEISHGTGTVCGKPKEDWPGVLAKDVREVLSRLQPVLETPEAVAALPDMRNHAENLKAFLAAAKVGELTKAAHKLLGTITEVTPDHVREYTGNVGSAWKQVQATLVYQPPPTAPKSGPAGKKSGPVQQEDVPSGMADFDRAQQSQATFASSNKKKEQDIQSARIIQDAWRKYRAARQAEQARLDLEARRSVLLETMQDLYQRSPSIRRNFAAMRARALAVLEERRMQQLHAARQQALAEEAKKSDLLAAIRTHRTALDDVDGRLGSVGLASASCPVCPNRPTTVVTPLHKAGPVPQRAAVVPGVTPPPLRAIPAQQDAAGAADTPTSPPLGGKSWADRAAIHAVPPPSTRLIKAAMRPMVVQTHAEHTSLPSHAAALEKFKAFRDSYLISVCSCMWWVEVLRVAADKAVQGLKEEPEAGAEAKADQVAVMTALATQKGHLAELPDMLQLNLVRPALQSREWNVGVCDQFAMKAARVAFIAAKKLVEAGQAERLCAAIAAGRQGNADWLPVADASELEAQEQAIKAGEMPLSLVRLAQTLLGEVEVNRLLGRQVAASETDAPRPPEGASAGAAAAEAPTSIGASQLPVLSGWAAAAAVGATKAGGLAGDADEAMLLGQAAMDVTDEELLSAMARKQEEDERDEEEEEDEEEEWETVTKGRKQGGKGGMRGAVGGGSGPNAQANRRRAGPSQNRFQGPRGGGYGAGGVGAGPGGGAQAQARRAGR